MSARGASLTLPTMPITAATLVAQVISSDGECWGARFIAPYDKNLAETFKDEGD